MRAKPVFFIIMPYVFVAMALAMPLQISLVYGIWPWELSAVLTKLTPLNMALMAMFIWSAWAVKNFDQKLFIALPFINLAVFANNYIVGAYGEDFHLWQTALASAAFLTLSLSFYGKNVYHLISNKSSRWWLTAPRKRLDYPVTIHTCQETIRTKSFDISDSGIFTRADDELRLLQAAKEQEVELSIHVHNRVFKCRGKIVRKSLPKGIYPEGVGIQFSQTDHHFHSWLYEQPA